jgi:hypothetical protein
VETKESILCFSALSQTGTIFEKKLLNIKLVLIFYQTFVCNVPHSKTNPARYYKFTHLFKQSVSYACQILMKLGFSRQLFKKSLNIKFHENRQMGAELFHTDRHDEANSRFSQFCESAKSPNMSECDITLASFVLLSNIFSAFTVLISL